MGRRDQPSAKRVLTIRMSEPSRVRMSARGALVTLLVLAGCAPRGVSRPADPALAAAIAQGPDTPALAVLISIDQLRADMPERLLPRFGKDGFRRFYEQGVVYESAAYAHSATETAVGHATLATGALPRDHGIVGNEWSERGARIYAVDDAASELLGASGVGKSPVRLLVDTVGDVLVSERPGALVRSVSEKERSAILLAGHKGVAYWLDDGAGTFVTSRYYADRLPTWVEEFGHKHPAESFRKRGWKLLAPEREYAAPDDHAWEARGGAVLGTVFPHAFGEVTGEQYLHAVKSTPFGDALTLDFVRALLASESLGKDRAADLLAVSFASTDYVGHAFGPESREAEDNLLQLDRVLAQLFELLDERVGKGRYFAILSGDHGACESPEWFLAQGRDAGRVDPSALRRTVEQGLRQRFDVGVELVSDFVNPALVLNEQRIAALSLDLAAVEQAAVELAKTVPGVHAAHARSDLLAQRGPDHPFKLRMEQSTHPERSGHVYVVPKEHWLLATRPEKLTAMHGTPWPYDAEVPIVVWGTGAKAQRVRRAVDPRDIAVTIAELLKLSRPKAATGQPLREALP
jgi:predicted AlkP superfamily pyrophosphatase or phosphodiesterase